MTELLLWSYVVLVTGAAAWFFQWSRDPKGIPQAAYWIVITILLWSGAWHAITALGGAETEVAGRPVDLARYFDWLLTAPLLVVALSFTATHAVAEKRRSMVAVMVAASVLMILCGFAADLMADRTVRFAVYGIGVLPLLVLLGQIWGPLRATAGRQPRPMAALYTVLAVLLGGLWIAFPLVWILGPAGLEWFGELANTTLFLVLSLLMKVGWSLVDIGRLRSLAERGEFAVE